jgi:regulator of protease activity HflC (stomatin/prohibitin superfamily)
MQGILDIFKGIFGWLTNHSPIQIIPETESGVRWTLGVMKNSKSGGVMFIVPFAELVDRVDITTGAFSFAPQMLTTLDLQTVTVQLGVTYHVEDACKMLLHLGDNDTEEVVAVIGRGILVTLVRETEFYKLIADQKKIERKIRARINNRVEQYGLTCDSAHLMQCGETIGVRLFQH